VIVDTFSKLLKINNFMAKARTIIKILTFKTQDIEKAREITQKKEINNILYNVENLKEILKVARCKICMIPYFSVIMSIHKLRLFLYL